MPFSFCIGVRLLYITIVEPLWVNVGIVAADSLFRFFTAAEAISVFLRLRTAIAKRGCAVKSGAWSRALGVAKTVKIRRPRIPRPIRRLQLSYIGRVGSGVIRLVLRCGNLVVSAGRAPAEPTCVRAKTSGA